MRILLNGIPLLTPLSGVGRYVHSMAEAMMRLDDEDLFSFYYYGYWSPRLRGRPSPAVEAARDMGRRFGAVYSASRAMLEGAFRLTHRLGRFDLYHETCFVPFRFNGPTVVTVFDLSFHHFPETHPPERLRFLKETFYARLPWATHFITISEFVRDEMVRNLGIPREKISVTYPGVDDLFRPRGVEELGRLPAAYGLAPGNYILFVGNLEPRKNVGVLLEAYARLPGAVRQRFPLVLAGGEGWGKGDETDRLARLGIAGNVKRVGYVPQNDLPYLYAGASAFVYPSLYEGFGLPPVEAMACGCPTIVSRAGSLPEVVGDAAALVDPKDPAGLSETLRKVLEDPTTRTALREAGIRRARNFNWELCGSATLDVYHRVAEKRERTLRKGRPAVFLDRDGTLNVDRDYVARWKDWEWIPGARESVKALKAMGFEVIVATNQAGVARGLHTAADVEALHRRVNEDLAAAGTSIDAFYYCPHGPADPACDCRKPAPGMLLRAARERGLDLERSFLVGDKVSDIEAGRAAGVRPIFVLTGHGPEGKDRVAAAVPVERDLSAAVARLRTLGSPASAPSDKSVFTENGQGGLRCPACGGPPPFSAVERVEGFRIVRCDGCGLEFCDPMKAGDGAWYDEAYVIRHAAIDTRIQDYYRWAVRFLPRAGKLLDVGCGEGVFVHFARRHGFDITGIDFSHEAVELGKRWFKMEGLYHCSLADLKSRPDFKGFQAATFFEVLEHVGDPGAFLREIKDLLAPGGRVALSVPFRDRWPVRDLNDYPPNHLTRWTPKALRTLFARNGYDVVRVDLGSSFRSFWMFLGYLFRAFVYRYLGVDFKKRFPDIGSGGKTHWLRRPWFKAVLSSLRPRHLREAMTFPFAVVLFPFLGRRFKGNNLMLLARVR